VLVEDILDLDRGDILAPEIIISSERFLIMT